MAFYLITGGAGFIGSNIVEELLRRGQRVRVLDNFSTGRRENLRPFSGRIELLEGDIRDPKDARKAVAGVDYILHQAALPSVARSVEDPIASNETNVSGMLNLLTCAKEAAVKRFVFASSSSVYGDTPTLPKVETMPLNPTSPYAVSKLAGEHYCRIFHRIYGLETVCLRYFNIFGPRQNPDSQYSAVIPLFIKSMLASESPTIFGDGLQSRDFTFIANVVNANLLAAQAPQAAGGAFNIACGGRYSLLDLVGILNSILGGAIAPRHREARNADVKHSQADIAAAGRFLGYAPTVRFEEGLRRTVDWYKMNR